MQSNAHQQHQNSPLPLGILPFKPYFHIRLQTLAFQPLGFHHSAIGARSEEARWSALRMASGAARFSRHCRSISGGNVPTASGISKCDSNGGIELTMEGAGAFVMRRYEREE